jgi:hypothetical protein
MTGRKTIGVAFVALAVGLLGVSSAFAAAPAKARTAAGNAHYAFRGHLRAISTTSVLLTVEGGNRIALRKLLGASVEQSFAVGPRTEFLKWAHGVPTVVQAGDLAAGDWVVVNVRAPRGADLAQIEAQGAGIVADRGTRPNPPTQPLFLFRGKLAAVAGSGAVALDVTGGNHRALRLLLGGPASQTFAFGPETIFLRWQGNVPTVIDASQLRVGDRVTVRIRAPRGSSLAQVAATPAVHVGEHEPASSRING